MRKAGKFLQLPFYARWTDGGGQMEVDRWRWTDGGIQKGKQVWIVHMTNIIGIFSNNFFLSELCWGKAMGGLYKDPTRKKEESERLRGESQIKFNGYDNY